MSRLHRYTTDEIEAHFAAQSQEGREKVSAWVRTACVVGAVLVALGVILVLAGCRQATTPATSNLTAGHATAAQLCRAIAGSGVENSITGQDTHTTIMSARPEGVSSWLNSSGNEVARCSVTDSTGTVFDVRVTLFHDGSIGWHAG